MRWFSVRVLPGFILMSRQLLDDEPDPTEDDILPCTIFRQSVPLRTYPGDHRSSKARRAHAREEDNSITGNAEER